MLDAWRLVNAAKIWQSAPMLTSFSPPTIGYNEKIPRGAEALKVSATVTERDALEHKLKTLEHVQVTLTIDHGRRGDIEVIIQCPSGIGLTLSEITIYKQIMIIQQQLINHKKELNHLLVQIEKKTTLL